MVRKKQKIPFKLELVRFKNSGFFNFADRIIFSLKPRKKIENKPRKILFIKNDRIGDAILTIPVIRDLKLNYPEFKVHVLISNKNSEYYANLDCVDKVITYDYKDLIGNIVIFDPPVEKNLSGRAFGKLYGIPLAGHLIQFIYAVLIPYIFKKSARTEISRLKAENYDAVIDLGGSKRLAIFCNMIARFSIGPKLFGMAWLYSYYLHSNWVSGIENDFMTRKIEYAVTDALNLKFSKRDKSLPYSGNAGNSQVEKRFDILFHIGSTELRKLQIETEAGLLESLKQYKVCVVDSSETMKYKYYKANYADKFTFNLFDSLNDIIPVAAASRLLLCYDGGQVHLLSQFVRTVAIFGPGSVDLWKPFEFEDYALERTFISGMKVIKSKGAFGHKAVYLPVWCSPCFDIGCESKLCLNSIDVESLKKVIIECIN
ncbi:MAG: glycosyltransferase family 9 protein [Ignavibacteria bacterium]|nr:hypothetical protein [Ignavibacteria bacterium]MCC7158962.1 glycosyltransferase family 9 protein [Ignavibacteria bacterium]